MDYVHLNCPEGTITPTNFILTNDGIDLCLLNCTLLDHYYLLVTNMYHIVYVSSASSKFSEEELLSILDGARKANEALGVTGLLVYIDGNIIQLLEGEENDVKTIYAKIVLDTPGIPVSLNCYQVR